MFLEPVLPAPRLLIAGGGHVARALAAQAWLVGFEVTVIDDRPEFTHPDRFPDGVATRCGPIAQQLADLPITPDTYVVIVTRGHRHDADALRACLHSSAAYIGMIGSRRKVKTIFEHLRHDGIQEDLIQRVRSPIGLNIGSETPAEIAVSIMAEVIMLNRRRDGRPMKIT